MDSTVVTFLTQHSIFLDLLLYAHPVSPTTVHLSISVPSCLQVLTT